MSTDNPLFLRDDDLDVAILMIERSQRLIASDVADLLDKAGLGATHDLVLRLVARRPSVPMVDLKRSMTSSKQTLSRVIAELDAKGLVVLETKATDRRLRPARITEAGQILLANLDGVRRRRMRRTFRVVGPDAVIGFRQVLELLLEVRPEPDAAQPARSGPGE